MHIPENYLSPQTCGIFDVAMIPIWGYAIKKVEQTVPKQKMPLLGVAAAFCFLAMMFNVPLPGGTTGHAVGGTLIAVLFGPWAACISVSVALVLQAVFFGDGGILAIGANCFNMAFVLPFVGFAFYRVISDHMTGLKGQITGAAVGAYLGINAAALCAAIEFGIQPSLFTDAAGQALYCPYPLAISVPAMMIGHLTVFGACEAIFTAAVLTFVIKMAPNFGTNTFALSASNARTFGLDASSTSAFGLSASNANAFDASVLGANLSASASPSTNTSSLDTNSSNTAAATATMNALGAAQKTSVVPVFVLVGILILATPLGLLAQGTAWGEWGADEIAEVEEGGQALGYTPEGLSDGWSLDALMPDYSLEALPDWAAYILSAVIGVACSIIIFRLAATLMKDKTDFGSKPST